MTPKALQQSDPAEDSGEINKARKIIIHYLKGSQGVASRRNIYNAANREAGSRLPPKVLAGALQALLNDGTITRETGERLYEVVYRTSRSVPIWKEPRKGGARDRVVATLDDLILRHVGKTGECNYTQLSASVAFRAKAPELNDKICELAAAGKLVVTPNVKRGKGRPSTIISLTPLAVAEAQSKTEATESAAADPIAQTPRPAKRKELTEQRLRLAIGELGGRATLAELTGELKASEEDVTAVLTALINAGTVRTLAIRGETYYRVSAVSRED